MKKTNNNSRTGTSVATVVQIVFIILKLVGVIDWRWAVILIPLWIDLGTLALVALLWLLAIAFNKWRNK
jgi:membrane protein YdbS with pleckstrin-like domain